MTDYSDCKLTLNDPKMQTLVDRILDKQALRGLDLLQTEEKLAVKIKMYSEAVENAELDPFLKKLFKAHLNLYQAARHDLKSDRFDKNFVTFHLNQASEIFSTMNYEESSLYRV